MYQVGWSKSEITGLSYKGYAMMGWGMWHNRATGQTTPLYARSFCISEKGSAPTAIICCLDLAYVTYAMRKGVVKQLQDKIAGFNEDLLVMTATHTHSGPAGCSQEALYNIITPGYLPQHVEAIINATVISILAALNQQKDTHINLAEDSFADDVPIAWNRSVQAFNKNPEIKKHKLSQTHLALDRTMRVLSFERAGELASLLSIFGVHATCVGNTHNTYNGDNKGYASAKTEELFENQGIEKPVAVYAQGVAGDISPYFQGKGDIARRNKLSEDDQINYAKNNGHLQADKALDITKQSNKIKLSGSIDGVLAYYDFTNITAKPEHANGNKNASTGDPCIGVTMFEGTRVDGPGMAKPLGFAAKKIARHVKRKRLSDSSTLSLNEKAYYQKLYQVHGTKDILMEDERKLCLGFELDKIALPNIVDPTVDSIKKQAKSGALATSPLVPHTLPLQIVRIGQLAIVCCPGEFTTISGQRIQEMLHKQLASSGVSHVIMMTYCNEFMGYVTTNEEYQLQLYEAGHTVYGQWTQAAFQTKFEELADELAKSPAKRSRDYLESNKVRPAPIPEKELALRTNLKPPKRW